MIIIQFKLIHLVLQRVLQRHHGGLLLAHRLLHLWRGCGRGVRYGLNGQLFFYFENLPQSRILTNFLPPLSNVACCRGLHHRQAAGEVWSPLPAVGPVRLPDTRHSIRRPHSLPGAALLLHSPGLVLLLCRDLVRHPLHGHRGDRPQQHQGPLYSCLPVCHEHHRR